MTDPTKPSLSAPPAKDPLLSYVAPQSPAVPTLNLACEKCGVPWVNVALTGKHADSCDDPRRPVAGSTYGFGGVRRMNPFAR